MGAFLAAGPFTGPDRMVRLVPLRANGQPGFAAYRRSAADSSYLPAALHALSVKDGRTDAIDGFIEPRLFRPLGLPERLG